MRRTLAILFFAVTASAATVTFESYPTGGVNVPVAPGTDIEGLTVGGTGQAALVGDANLCLYGGCYGTPQFIGADGVSEPTIPFTLTGGGVFSVKSFDGSQALKDGVAAALAGYPNGQGVRVVGTVSGGGTVTASFELGQGFTTYTLVGFDNLTGIEFNAYITGGPDYAAFVLDNIVYQAGAPAAVPEPGTVALLGAGLGLLGLLRRKR